MDESGKNLVRYEEPQPMILVNKNTTAYSELGATHVDDYNTPHALFAPSRLLGMLRDATVGHGRMPASPAWPLLNKNTNP